MSILGRLSTLIRSNLNDAIDAMQDPAKEIDQLVVDMEDSARQARSEVAACLAEEKRLVRQIESLDAEVRTWDERAVTAVKAGDDALAREALRRKGEKEAERLAAEKALQEQKLQGDQLTVALKALEARVKDVKMRQGTLRERARANKAGGSPLSSRTAAFNDFERLSSKVDAVEAEAGLTEDLAGRNAASVETERKLADLGRSAEDKTLDDALSELKKKLGS